MTSELPAPVSDTFDPTRWRTVDGFEDLTDLTYHRGFARPGPDDVAAGAVARDLPVVRVAFDRPEVRNAFRPHTVDELYRVLDHARTTSDVGAVLLTGNGPSPRDGGWAFCSGGDQRIRGRTGYQYAESETEAPASCATRRWVSAPGPSRSMSDASALARSARRRAPLPVVPAVVGTVINGPRPRG